MMLEGVEEEGVEEEGLEEEEGWLAEIGGLWFG